MRNFLNANDVFPILEMIRREIRKNDFNKDRVYIGNEEPQIGNPDDVVSVELLRGGNSYDPEMITSIAVIYADGATETVTLIRGANPPVPNTVPDYEFINNALISGLTVQTVAPYGSRTVTGSIVRENGYGRIQRIDLTYS